MAKPLALKTTVPIAVVTSVASTSMWTINLPTSIETVVAVFSDSLKREVYADNGSLSGLEDL
ncbi:hypothetical protein H2248_002893, partial [Termitomyces sp. 'cryptogamus']